MVTDGFDNKQTCKICDKDSNYVFTAKIIGKYDVSYFKCSECHFVQTEEPYWLEEAYAIPINFSDTGIISRNQVFSKIVTSLIFCFFKKDGKFLDYAGGYGIFTRIMRDIGFDFYWNDPYTDNLVSRGFEENANIKYDLITTFESFEHFVNPIEEVEKILKRGNNIIFSTQLIPSPTPNISDWWYYAPEHGQHVALHTKKSLKILGDKFNLNYYNLDNLHVFSRKKLPFWGEKLLRVKHSKYLFYGLYYFFSIFMKSRTMEDMYTMKTI